MRRALLQSKAFVRAARRLVKKHPQSSALLGPIFAMLAEDAYNPALKTHKLKGEHAESWACSVSYDLRIVFQIVEHEGAEAILLQSIGTHDQVY